MKKQVAIVVSFCALLTLSVFAPKEIWLKSHDLNRFPASEEVQVEEQQLEEKAQIDCIKDEGPSELEEEMKKLVADKEAILKEIDELKSSKVEIKAEKLAKSSDKDIIIALMSQMTSMMISQQEHQQVLMQQMFTMMNQMPMQSYPQQQLQNQPSSIFGNLAPGIGIGYLDQSAVSAQNPYEVLARYPSAQADQNFIQKEVNIQPQLQSQYSVGNMGFNFLTSDSSSEMQRMMF